MRKTIWIVLPMVWMAMWMSGCGKSKAGNNSEAVQVASQVNAFDGDSAYRYCQVQCDFGARVPGTEAHRRCGDWIVSESKRMGAEVEEQVMDVRSADGKTFRCRNIIARMGMAPRVLMMAHYDCRPWADQDPTEAGRKQPVMGASDGASGVAVMLEMMRQMGKSDSLWQKKGVEFVFVDCEDMGEAHSEEGWCLGSAEWSKRARASDYTFGVLLDMVGAESATFPKEGYSMQYASKVTNDIWRMAKELGYGARFRDVTLGMITDDHVQVNEIAGIPMVDVIQFDERGFGDYWHTTGDDMRVISVSTLDAVGEVMMRVTSVR